MVPQIMLCLMLPILKEEISANRTFFVKLNLNHTPRHLKMSFLRAWLL